MEEVVKKVKPAKTSGKKKKKKQKQKDKIEDQESIKQPEQDQDKNIDKQQESEQPLVDANYKIEEIQSENDQEKQDDGKLDEKSDVKEERKGEGYEEQEEMIPPPIEEDEKLAEQQQDQEINDAGSKMDDEKLKEWRAQLEKEVQEDIEKELEDVQDIVIIYKREKSIQEHKVKEFDADIDVTSDNSLSDEEEKDVKHLEVSFEISTKFANTVLVFKKKAREKKNVFQGEAVRIRKRMGMISTKTPVYLTINQNKINMYSIPLKAKPTRQFLFDCEKLEAKVDTKHNDIIRIVIGKKEYVFKVDDEETARKWVDFINESVSNIHQDDDQQDKMFQKMKTWKTPHVTKRGFLKEANTFDMLQFKDHGQVNIGILLQTIDKSVSRDLLYENYPEVLYFNNHLKKVIIRPVDEITEDKDPHLIPLINYKPTFANMESARNCIFKLIKDAKENDKYSSKDFACFIQDLYSCANVVALDKNDKKLQLKVDKMFDEERAHFVDDTYFDAPHKII